MFEGIDNRTLTNVAGIKRADNSRSDGIRHENFVQWNFGYLQLSLPTDRPDQILSLSC